MILIFEFLLGFLPGGNRNSRMQLVCVPGRDFRGSNRSVALEVSFPRFGWMNVRYALDRLGGLLLRFDAGPPADRPAALGRFADPSSCRDVRV
ncbi:MAG: hypothetical protein ACYC35_26775 [Pirellulales bacterium]